MRTLVGVDGTDTTMTADIKCNSCETGLWHSRLVDNPSTPEYLEFEHKWSKGGEWKGASHQFHLCMSCYKKLVNSFKLPLNIFSGR